MTNICYQKHKERHQNISEEEKSRRRKKVRERYQNFTEEREGKRKKKGIIRIFLRNKSKI